MHVFPYKWPQRGTCRPRSGIFWRFDVSEAFFTRNPSDLFCAIQLYIIVPLVKNDSWSHSRTCQNDIQWSKLWIDLILRGCTTGAWDDDSCSWCWLGLGLGLGLVRVRVRLWVRVRVRVSTSPSPALALALTLTLNQRPTGELSRRISQRFR